MELNELKGKIRARGKTYADVALEMRIGVNTLSNKLNGISSFTATEMIQLAKILQLGRDEILACFFPTRMSGASQE